MMNRHLTLLGLSLVLLTAVTGCKKPIVDEAKDYGRQLPPGQSALRKITDPAMLPDLKPAFERKDAALDEALARSLAWFAKPSTQQYFPTPVDQFSHPQIHASVFAFRQLLATSASASEFEQKVLAEFDVYISVGWNDHGDVLYTGYFTPIFTASKVQTPEYRYPLYKRPADLASDPVTGKTLGRRVSGQVQPYPTRAQIEASHMLAGSELVWMKDRFDAYIVQVNGSAKLSMTDGSTLYIGYAGTNGYDYTSVGGMLVKDGKLDKNRVNLATIRAYFRDHPQDLDTYLARNDRFVFFQPYDAGNWPAGSLGEKVTPMRSLATDKTIFPRGSVVLAATSLGGAGGAATGSLQQFMLDQDTGGAIRAAGRADIYMGVGNEAEQLAGSQYAEGQLYYLILKPERVGPWHQQLRSAKPARSVAMAE